MPPPQLQALPSELLLAIALHVPQSALNALTHSCRRLNQVITPLLYESVHWQRHHHPTRLFNHEPFFWQQVHFPNQPSLTRQANALVIPSSGSRIFDLDAFTRTTLSSESLRSLVKSVDLRWHNEYFNHDDSVRCCLQTLESSHLRTLHLSPAHFFFEVPARPAVTSLAFQIDDTWVYNPDLCTMNFEHLYTLFCIPSLIHLRLKGWPLWSFSSGEGRAWASAENVGASNIEDLALTGAGAGSGGELREVLSWPKALKRFTFVYNQFKDSATVQSVVQNILQQQRLTLEYLHFGVPNCSGKEQLTTDSDISKSLVLQDFPALKHSHICAYHLARPVCISG